jgi:hypothetical protein
MTVAMHWSKLLSDRIESSALIGREFLGAVDGCGCLELVFDDDGRGPNLLSVWPDGRIAIGGVAGPQTYIEAQRDSRKQWGALPLDEPAPHGIDTEGTTT